MNFVGDWIYISGAMAVILIVPINAFTKSKVYPIVSLYLIEWILFLKTIDEIKRNFLEPSLFVGPYLVLLIINIALWTVVAVSYFGLDYLSTNGDKITAKIKKFCRSSTIKLK